MSNKENTGKASIKFIPYYGSKRRMVKKLKKMIPKHTTYIEPFVGSGALLLNHERSDIEIANDKKKYIANMFDVMANREKGRQFIKEIKTINYGKELFKTVKSTQNHCFSEYSDLERAAMQYYLLTSSFNATGKSFASKRVSSAEEYRRRVNRFLEEVYDRMDGVKVLNVDALDLVEAFAKDENAFIFMDPPYLKSVRGKGADKVYGCEMELSEHIKMLKLIGNAKAKIMLCGYWSGENDLYDKMLIPYGWERHFVGEFAKSAQRRGVREKGNEYIWVNYELPNIEE